MKTASALKQKFALIWPHLDERARRMMAANEARELGYGGVSMVSRACGLSRVTIIKGIQELLPGFPIVMHGSSSVPQDEVERINAAGGEMKGAKGVAEEQISQAAKMGVTKVNIDTDGRLVWCRVHREHFRDHPENFDLRKPGTVFQDEYAAYIAHKNEVLGSAGRLDEVRTAVS